MQLRFYNMPLTSYRAVNALSAVVCAWLFIFAFFYLQEYLSLQPCYLCFTQRFFIVACGLAFAIATVHNPEGTGRKAYAGCSSLFTMAAAFFSMKQIWLQNLPDDLVPTCGPPVEYLIKEFSVLEVIPMLFKGDGSCADIQWQLFGLSIPVWVLINSVGLLTVSLYQMLRE
ncbi:MAG: disulfide bond formation protein B [Porticoccaceae bacterium]|nr:disulfide bond formation protein B [Porticoccaceae bacterium]|tara:strand:+ start:383 stop:895 length:513 start_codon:yes stop_codon:yes gene_type:complete